MDVPLPPFSALHALRQETAQSATEGRLKQVFCNGAAMNRSSSMGICLPSKISKVKKISRDIWKCPKVDFTLKSSKLSKLSKF